MNEIARSGTYLLSVQIVLGLITAGGFYWAKDFYYALSALAGTLGTVLFTLLLQWVMQRAHRAAGQSDGKSQGILYAGALLRFVVLGLYFALTIAWLEVQALALCVGFAVSQLSYVIAMRVQAKQHSTS